MKLISLHINNYGNLSNYDYSFSNLNQFVEDNGYGKSTLASYMKAMFYGLESVKTNSAKFLDRKHYYPFKGGKFGGNIIFTYQNNEYRIERDFDEKSDTKDTLTVYKNNNLTDELGPVPGETIFGINKESFERLILINADKINIETDNDINKKLNNYVENVGEEFDIDSLIKDIKVVKKNKKDASGIKKDHIKELENDIHNLEAINEALDSKYLELNEASRKANETTEAYDKAAKSGAVLEKWNSYEMLLANIKTKEDEIKVINDKYPVGLPSVEEINKVKEHNEKIKINNVSLTNKKLKDDDANEFKRLDFKYKDNLPSEEVLNDIEATINSYESLKKENEDLTKSDKSTKEKELEEHFLGVNISEEEINKISDEVDSVKNLQSAVELINPTNLVKEDKPTQNKENKWLVPVIFAVSLAIMGTGVGLIFVLLELGISIIALGVVILIFDIFLYFKKSLKTIKGNNTTIEQANPVYETKVREIEAKRSQLMNKFAIYRYKDDSPEVLLYRLKNDYAMYKEILANKEGNQEKIKANEESIKNSEDKLNKFFKSVQMENVSYRTGLGVIKKELTRYETLKGIVNNADKDKGELVKENEKSFAEVASFYTKYQINKDILITSVENDLLTHTRLLKEKENAEQQANNYKEDNKLSEKPVLEEFDLEPLKEQMDKAKNEYISLKQEIENLETQTASLDDKINELSETKDARKQDENDVKLLTSLNDEILKADQVLKDKYVAPIRDKFVDYAKLIEDTMGEKVVMDKNYKISFDREGALRSYEHLSGGNLAICALCFRLAILDNMFEDELPFIILDDPFMGLDANHLDKTRALIKALNKNKQIIYFCCHDSRRL